MENEYVALGTVEAFARDPENAIVFARGRDISRRHPFELQPQHVQRFGPLDCFFDAVENPHTEFIDCVWQQRSRPAHRHLGAEFCEAPDIRSCDARVQDVTTDADSAAFEISEPVTQSQNVEQALCWMLVGSVASVDHIRLNSVRQEFRRARRRVTNHYHVDSHRLEIARRVHQRFALRHAGPGRRYVHRIRGESLFSELERDPRPGRILEEQIDDRGAAQGRNFFYRAFADLLERLGGIENKTNLLARQRLEPKQILAESTPHAAHLGTITTSVRSSSSATMTSTRSSPPTPTFFPTTSA